MRNSNDSSEGEPAQITATQRARPFNPLATYFYIAVAILVSYALFYAFGYMVLIVVMIFFLVDTVQGGRIVLRDANQSFARYAALFNIALAVAGVAILSINAVSLAQLGHFLIMPDVRDFTLVCPLFVLMSNFGIRNLRGMYTKEPA